MTNHTIDAALDLLFCLQRCKEETDKINDAIYRLDTQDDFHPRVCATMGGIEGKMVDFLDLYLEEITGCESLATHMLYETGKVTHGQKEYYLHHRKEFEDFIEDIKP